MINKNLHFFSFSLDLDICLIFNGNRVIFTLSAFHDSQRWSESGFGELKTN